jgi:hypothetical protein
VQLVEVRFVGRAQEGSDTDKGGSGLRCGRCREHYGNQANQNYSDCSFAHGLSLSRFRTFNGKNDSTLKKT